MTRPFNRPPSHPKYPEWQKEVNAGATKMPFVEWLYPEIHAEYLAKIRDGEILDTPFTFYLRHLGIEVPS